MKFFLLCFLAIARAEGPEFFRTNIQEFEDYPLKFDNPLPSWLKGTLVRFKI